MACGLEILAAAWGPSNVTDKIWKLVTRKGLEVEASNKTFGPDPLRGCKKTLVVCYRFPGGKPILAITKENSTLSIKAPGTKLEEETSLNEDWQIDISNTSSRNPSCQNSIEILGAAWGTKEVTENAQKYITTGDVDFVKLASNETWDGDSWAGVFKTLVVVYQYFNIPMMSIVKERETMSFTVSPPLFILGAAYGLEVVTNEVQDLVENHQLTLAPTTNLPNDVKPNFKSVVIVYQFGNEEPQLYIGDHSDVCIQYSHDSSKREVKEVVKVDPHQLIILGAAYGLQDVTSKIRRLVFENKLKTSVNNTTMEVVADTWRWHSKTLVVIYRYGTGPPKVSITEQDEDVKIKKKVPPIYGGLIDSKNLVSNTDIISLIALNNMYVACDDQDSSKLTVSDDKTSACEFDIVQPISNSYFFLQEKKTQKFCEIDDEGYLILKGDRGKTGFILTLSLSGKVQLATVDNKFVRLAGNQFLKADSTEHFSASTSFQLEIDCSSKKNESDQSPSNEIRLSSDKKQWLSFVWRATGGFFLALGLEPFLSLCEPSVELLHLLHENSATSEALQNLREELRSTTSETEAICSGIHFIKKVWKQGLLWAVFKFLRLQKGKIIYTEIFTRIAQAVLIPKTEACLLLTGLTTWAIQLMAESKKLNNILQ